MPLNKIQGLRGLPGLNRLSDKERAAFYEGNKALLSSGNFRGPRAQRDAANIIFNNKQFVNRFGQDVFNQYNDGTEEAYNMRNNLLTNSIVEEEWNKYLSPFSADGTRDNNKGLGAQWEKYNDMSTEAKLKVLESDWWNPTEFKSEWDKYSKAKAQESEDRLAGLGVGFGLSASDVPKVKKAGDAPKNISDEPWKNRFQDLIGTVGGVEAERQMAFERNNNILESIYNDDLKDRTYKLSSDVSQAYMSPEIYGKSDNQIKRLFYDNFVDEKSDMVQLGAGELAAYWGEDELKDMSVDDMRQWLAKKQAYMKNMAPGAASIALNNEAKEYVKDHQSSITRAGLFLKDAGISALSYTADKANGIYNLGLMAADKMGDLPTVWMNEKGEIIDAKTVLASSTRDDQGKIHYKDSEGADHVVKQVQVPRTTLHNMGKNFDGSDDDSIFNPLYWTRAEQFGTLGAEEQKHYEKLGVSPYKVAYDPNEESDLWLKTLYRAHRKHI